MKSSKQSTLKTTTMLVISITVLAGILLNPAMASDISEFAGQTSGSGRVWWWFWF